MIQCHEGKDWRWMSIRGKTLSKLWTVLEDWSFEYVSNFKFQAYWCLFTEPESLTKILKNFFQSRKGVWSSLYRQRINMWWGQSKKYFYFHASYRVQFFCDYATGLHNLRVYLHNSSYIENTPFFSLYLDTICYFYIPRMKKCCDCSSVVWLKKVEKLSIFVFSFP